MPSNIDLNNGTIVNLVDPTNAQDAATKAYVDSGAGGGGSQEIYPHYISGFQPEKNSSTKIKLFAGAIANASSNPQDVIQVRVTAGLIIDLTTVGALGRDTGSLTDNSCWNLFVLADPNEVLPVTAIASQSETLSAATIPAGYTTALGAKLPFSFIYRQTIGIPDFRLRGWPSRNTEVRYSDWDTADTAWRVVDGVTGTGSYVNVDLYTAGADRWVPNNARMALIHYEFEGVTAAGELRFQLGAGSSKEQLIDYVKSGDKKINREWMTVTSGGIFKYKAPTGTKVTLRCLGYQMSEV